MDEHTEELRELFVETTGAEEVTEDQQEEPGELSDAAAASDAQEQVRELVERMRERYEFASTLGTESLAEVVLGFYAGESDAELAETLDVTEETVFTARLDLHLLREGDRDAPFPFADLRELVVEDVPLAERAARLDADEETVERCSGVAEAEVRSTRANHRFVDGFEELLTDADLTDSHTASARKSGLEEAAEDIETNTQL